MTEPATLMLASRSPRRRELLAQIGVRFELVTVDVPEQAMPGEAPTAYVQRLAVGKARAGAELVPGTPVLGADTIVVSDGQILEKPVDERDAVRMLTVLSGREHCVMTAVSVCCDREQQTRLSSTTVCLRPIDEEEARIYWRTGEPADKAGGYAVQGLGAVFVEHLTGSYSGVVGLPLAETCQLLEWFGVRWWAGHE